MRLPFTPVFLLLMSTLFASHSFAESYAYEDHSDYGYYDAPRYNSPNNWNNNNYSNDHYDNDGHGETDFYSFKNDQYQKDSDKPHYQAPEPRSHKPWSNTKNLPLSSLDVEDKNRARLKQLDKTKAKTSIAQQNNTTRQHHTFNHTNNSRQYNIPYVARRAKIQKARNVLTLSRHQCYRKLRKNKVQFTRLTPVRGVRMPVKIHSAIAGVRYRHTRNNSKYSIMDCRLAVALVGWSRMLKQYGIYEVVHMRTYSPGAIVAGTNKRSGHSWALAIDVSSFKSRFHGNLNVKYDWTDRRRGLSPCIKSTGASQPLKIMRSIVCKTATKQLFAMILTPHYNRAHHDHIHIELRPTLRRLVLR